MFLHSVVVDGPWQPQRPRTRPTSATQTLYSGIRPRQQPRPSSAQVLPTMVRTIWPNSRPESASPLRYDVRAGILGRRIYTSEIIDTDLIDCEDDICYPMTPQPSVVDAPHARERGPASSPSQERPVPQKVVVSFDRPPSGFYRPSSARTLPTTKSPASKPSRPTQSARTHRSAKPQSSPESEVPSKVASVPQSNFSPFDRSAMESPMSPGLLNDSYPLDVPLHSGGLHQFPPFPPTLSVRTCKPPGTIPPIPYPPVPKLLSLARPEATMSTILQAQRPSLPHSSPHRERITFRQPQIQLVPHLGVIDVGGSLDGSPTRMPPAAFRPRPLSGRKPCVPNPSGRAKVKYIPEYRPKPRAMPTVKAKERTSRPTSTDTPKRQVETRKTVKFAIPPSEKKRPQSAGASQGYLHNLLDRRGFFPVTPTLHRGPPSRERI